MPSTVRISNRGREFLGQLARQSGSTMTDVLDSALETFRRQQFLQQANASYASLAEDPVASKAYREEMDSFDATLDDGLEKFPPKRCLPRSLRLRVATSGWPISTPFAVTSKRAGVLFVSHPWTRSIKDAPISW